MEKILITGGSGTIGKAFIKNFPQYKYYNISRNENSIADLSREYPYVENYVGNIEDKDFLIRTFKKIKPDIVIHAAAMKHINIAEENPIQACNVNVIGSLNIISASIGLAKQEKTLKLTSKDMNRLMFSQDDAANLIYKTINKCSKDGGGFTCSYKMKSVNMLDLAKIISNSIKIVGLRPGEKLNEDLINKKEIDYTYTEDNMIYIYKDKNPNSNKLTKGYSSATAEKMSIKEMQELVWNKK